MQYGRKEIFTDAREVTTDNIIPILRSAKLIHDMNAADCNELIRIEKNDIDKIGEKITRTNIDFWIPMSLPSLISKFWMDFDWGNPITLVQRGEKDSGNSDEADAIALLNEMYDTEFIKRKTQELGRFVTICGVGYTLVEINQDWKEGDAPYKINVLDPRYAFVVRSRFYTDRRIVLAVLYSRDEFGNCAYTCYTKDRIFRVQNLLKIVENNEEKDVDLWGEIDRSGEKNPLGMIPMIEWIRDYDRMGCFERQIPEIQAISRMVSDTINQQNQNTNALWHANDIEFPVDENGETSYPGDGEWVMTETTRDGRQPFLKPLISDYNYNGTLEEINSLVNMVLIEANVPQRNDNSGGSTGVAMADATGWTHAEAEASRHDQIKSDCKAEEVRCVLSAIRETAIAIVDERLKDLKWSDCKANIKRQKNYEMTTKINTYATGVSHGIAPEHMLQAINLFDDPQQVFEDSREFTERYLASIFDKSNTTETDIPDRLQPDMSDQVSNSPNIDGMRKDEKVE